MQGLLFVLLSAVFPLSVLVLVYFFYCFLIAALNIKNLRLFKIVGLFPLVILIFIEFTLAELNHTPGLGSILVQSFNNWISISAIINLILFINFYEKIIKLLRKEIGIIKQQRSRHYAGRNRS